MSRRELGSTLRIVVADDERPARSFLTGLLRGYPDVEIVGEASDGAEAVTVIERLRPDLALLDLQMPEVDGIGVVRLLRKDRIPLIAFVTAYDAYAVKAFELHAIDYLLKPVAGSRLRETINRANEWLDRADSPSVDRGAHTARLTAAVDALSESQSLPPLLRIPVRRRDDIVLVPVEQVVTIVADGELLHLTASRNERHTITYRLKDLEARLPSGVFFRLSRGSLVRVQAIQKVSPMPGGTYVVTMLNGQTLSVSRSRARVLREQLLRL